MVYLLQETNVVFPDAQNAEDETGLLAIGGNLEIETLLSAYNKGIFPWFNDDEPICWYSPKERCVLYPADIVVSKSMQKILRDKVFYVTTNTAFADVITNCKNTKRAMQDGTWITSEMENAYIALHKAGYAKSVEVWQNKKLVGGLYGVQIKENVFCGESMFSHVSNASKAALIWLCKNENDSIIDCQVPTEHLLSMGATLIERKRFLQYLK
jgi:leucyl/phenylalanyl-tRNA---protein transferase